MVYSWKLPGMYDVPAQDAGEELERISRKHGKMDPSDIVDESRPENAVLHPCFEWDDPVAAEKWREQQARNICCCIITTMEPKAGSPVKVRAFVNVENTYQPIQAVIDNGEKMDSLFLSAMKELTAFKTKFASLSQLRPIFDAIDSLSA